MDQSRVQPSNEVELDLKALLGKIAKAKWKLLAASLIVGGVTGAALFVQPASYMADARLLFERQDAGFARSTIDAPNPQAGSVDEAMFESQIQVLTSRDLAARVIDKLGIIDKKELSETSLLSTLLGAVGIGGKKDPKDKAIANFSERLSINAVDRTRVITISYKSLEQDLSAKVVNAVVNDYQALQRNAKAEANKNSVLALQERITEIREQVKRKEAAVENYRSRFNLLQTTGDGTDTLMDQRLSDINATLARVRAEKTEAQARARRVKSLLRDGQSVDSVTEVSSNPLIQRLKEQELAQKGEIAELSATLLPAHPSIKALKTQLTQTSNAIRSEVRNVLQGLENDARIAVEREKDLMKDLNRLKVDVAGANSQSVKLRELEREAAADRELLARWLSRHTEALAMQNPDFLTPDARVIARATVPSEPAGKKLIAKTIVAMIGTFLVGAVFVVIKAFFVGDVFRQVEYQTYMPKEATVAQGAGGAEPNANSYSEQAGGWAAGGDVTRLASQDEQPQAPAQQVAPNVAPTAAPQENLQQDIVTLAASAALESAKKGKARIVMLSPGVEDGMAMAPKPVARTISKAGKAVILVSLGDEKLAGKADVAWEGLSDLIDGEADFSQIIYRDRLSRSHLVPRGSRALRVEDFNQGLFQTLLAALGQTYDVVLIDTGPFYQDDEVVQTLAEDGETLAVVMTPDQSDEEAIEIGQYLKSLGYSDVAVVVAGEGGIAAQNVA